MAKPAKKAAKKAAAKPEAEANPLIKKLSEVEAMSDEEKQAFRQSGGTTIQG